MNLKSYLLYSIALPKRSYHLRLRAVRLTVAAEIGAVFVFWVMLSFCATLILFTAAMAIYAGVTR